MKLATAVELRNRTRADAPVVVVVGGPGGGGELDRRITAAVDGRVELLGIAGADRDREIKQFLDDAGVDVIPCVLVYARGVLLERSSSVRDARAAAALLAVLPGLSSIPTPVTS
jgi:hypothetical protein